MSEAISLDRIGDLISALGLPEFGQQFFRMFEDPLAIDQCTVFAFKGQSPPNPIVLEAKSAELSQLSRKLAGDYVAGAFKDDPNVCHHRTYGTPTVHYLRADQVKNRFYRLHFYDEASVAHELVVLGQTQDTLYYLSFYRNDSRPGFGQHDVNSVSGLSQFAIKALHRHFALLGGADPTDEAWVTTGHGASMSPRQRESVLAHLTDVLLAEPYLLSPREAAVCAAIILGYTTLGIGLNLGISVNTVATHRKRAYRKLGICSQNELFSRYFQATNHRGAGYPRTATMPKS